MTKRNIATNTDPQTSPTAPGRTGWRRLWWVPMATVSSAFALMVPLHTTGTTGTNTEGVVCTSNYNRATNTHNFVLTAKEGYISTPDSNAIYMWSYANNNGAFQYPGPIFCVNEGEKVSITLQNQLPVISSIDFVGLTGVLADNAPDQPDFPTDSVSKPAPPGGTVTYSFTADHAGTYLYRSGTNPKIQVAMGLAGGIIVRPAGHPDYAYWDPKLALTVPSGGATVNPIALNATVTSIGVTPVLAAAIAPNTKITVGGNTFTVTSAGAAQGAGSIPVVSKTATAAAPAGTPVTLPPAPNPAYPSTQFNPAKEYVHILTEIDPDQHQKIEKAAHGNDPVTPATRADYAWHPVPTEECAALLALPAAPAAGSPQFADYQNCQQDAGYRARYWMINGRSFPDTIAPNFAAHVPSQPYSALVHVQPWAPATAGKDANPLPALIRYLNAGPVSYPFHPHSNHEAVVGVDARQQVDPNGGPNGSTPTDLSQDRFGIVVAPGQTVDAFFVWTDAQQWDPSTHPVDTVIPSQYDRTEGPFWNGSPYLGVLAPLATGTTQYNQCGEFYHVAHSHALFQATNYGISGSGMLTMVRVDPPASIQAKYGHGC